MMRHKVYLTIMVLAVVLTAVSALMAYGKREMPKTFTVAALPASRSEQTNFPVYVREAKGTPRVATEETDFHGQAVTVSCSTCHSTTAPNPETRRSEDLKDFHRGLEFNHGQLSCLSCHNSDDYDSLRLADGQSLPFANVQQLCAQCHGPQMRDYRKGSHGGMTGHWDLNRGPRTRNNCTDCHDPHSPAFQPMMPVFQPVPANKAAKNSH